MEHYNNFLSIEECKLIIQHSDTLIFEENLTAVRNFKYTSPSNYTQFNFLNRKLQEIGIENVKKWNINKYEKGAFFKEHTDRGGRYDPLGERVKTVVINLSEETDYTGGTLNVNGEKINPAQGTAVIFDSSFRHKVTEVTNGIRYSFSLWLIKENFKEFYKGLI